MSLLSCGDIILLSCGNRCAPWSLSKQSPGVQADWCWPSLHVRARFNFTVSAVTSTAKWVCTMKATQCRKSTFFFLKWKASYVRGSPAETWTDFRLSELLQSISSCCLFDRNIPSAKLASVRWERGAAVDGIQPQNETTQQVTTQVSLKCTVIV